MGGKTLGLNTVSRPDQSHWTNCALSEGQESILFLHQSWGSSRCDTARFVGFSRYQNTLPNFMCASSDPYIVAFSSESYGSIFPAWLHLRSLYMMPELDYSTRRRSADVACSACSVVFMYAMIESSIPTKRRSADATYSAYSIDTVNLIEYCSCAARSPGLSQSRICNFASRKDDDVRTTLVPRTAWTLLVVLATADAETGFPQSINSWCLVWRGARSKLTALVHDKLCPLEVNIRIIIRSIRY